MQKLIVNGMILLSLKHEHYLKSLKSYNFTLQKQLKEYSSVKFLLRINYGCSR